MSTSCVSCGSPIPEDRIRRHARFCSNTCNRKDTKEKYRERNKYNNIPTGTAGAISELIASVDLMQKGYQVYRALSPSSNCDLIVFYRKICIRVEVRTGHLTTAGKITFQRNDKDGKCDIYAVVTEGKNITYVPSLEEILSNIPLENN